MKEYKLSDLRSSVIQYDKNPPRFMIMIVAVIIVAMLLVAGVAATREKTEIVRSSGIVSSSEKEYIMSATQGKVEEINVHEGDFVSLGDRLLSLENAEADGQINAYEKIIEYYSQLIGNYQKIIDHLAEYDVMHEVGEIRVNENPFDKSSNLLFYSYYQPKSSDCIGYIHRPRNELRVMTGRPPRFWALRARTARISP
jgi:hypothetical protein